MKVRGGEESRAFLLQWLEATESDLRRVGECGCDVDRHLEAVRHLRGALRRGRLTSAKDWDSLLHCVGTHTKLIATTPQEAVHLATTRAAKHKRPSRESVIFWEKVRKLDDGKLRPEQVLAVVKEKGWQLHMLDGSFIRTLCSMRKKWRADASG